MVSAMVYSIWNSFIRILLVLVLILVVLPIGFCAAVWGYSFSLRTDLSERFPSPGTMIDIGTHRLHIYCTGRKGHATVILEGGNGGWSTYWNRVHQLVPSNVRVCSYDRSGLGWSERGPNPKDDESIVSELKQLMIASDEGPPYIMVGHSAGGPLSWLFAKNNPDIVAGIVMVDANTRTYRHWGDENASPTRKFVREHLRPLLVLVETTGVVLFPRNADSEAMSRYGYSEFQKEVVSDPGFRSRMISAKNAEGASHDDLNYMTSIGSMPLVVIEAGHIVLPISDNEWRRGQREMLTLSTNSIHIVAESVGHSIPRDGPEFIVRAIQDILGQN